MSVLTMIFIFLGAAIPISLAFCAMVWVFFFLVSPQDAIEAVRDIIYNWQEFLKGDE